MQSGKKVIGWQIDELDVVGFVEDSVGHCLALPDSRDLSDQIIQALDVLNVDGRPDPNAGFEQLFYVLPTLGMTRRRFAADEIRVSKLIDEEDGGVASQRGVQIELPAHDSAITDFHVGKSLESFEQPLRLNATVRLNVTDHDIGSAGPDAPRRLQHCVGFTYAGCRAKENPEAPALGARLFGLNVGEQLIRIGPLIGHFRKVIAKSRAMYRGRGLGRGGSAKRVENLNKRRTVAV